MRLAQLHRPLQAVASGGYRPALTYSLALRPALVATPSFRDGNASIEGRKYASVKSQGAYKLRPRKTIPKKLGAKRSGDQYVIPGNIIYKQRGTIWHPGENVILGRDHTIHAGVAGYVKYYRDPLRHPTRQYIGVAFNREDKLPYPRHAVRKRKLGMVAVPRKEGAPADLLSASGLPRRVVRDAYYDLPAETSKKTRKAKKAKEPQGLALVTRRWQERRRTRVLHLNSNYSYAEGNAAIGRLAGRTMYTAPWKLGGRKARFRKMAQNKKLEAKQKELEREETRQRQAEMRAAEGPRKGKASKGKDGKKTAA